MAPVSLAVIHQPEQKEWTNSIQLYFSGKELELPCAPGYYDMYFLFKKF